MNTPPASDFSFSGGSNTASSSSEYDFKPSSATMVVSKGLGLLQIDEKILLDELMKSDEDPILVFKKNPNWIYQANPLNTEAHRNTILDKLAQWEMPQGERRDTSASRFMFHFRNASDIDRCKIAMKNQFPEAFGMTIDARNKFAAMMNLDAATVPDMPHLGLTYIVHKLQVREDDVQLYPFFFL